MHPRTRLFRIVALSSCSSLGESGGRVGACVTSWLEVWFTSVHCRDQWDLVDP